MEKYSRDKTSIMNKVGLYFNTKNEIYYIAFTPHVIKLIDTYGCVNNSVYINLDQFDGSFERILV